MDRRSLGEYLEQATLEGFQLLSVLPQVAAHDSFVLTTLNGKAHVSCPKFIFNLISVYLDTRTGK